MKLAELNQLTVVGSINCGGSGQREVRAGVGPGWQGAVFTACDGVGAKRAYALGTGMTSLLG
jgi:hypothetical protein